MNDKEIDFIITLLRKSLNINIIHVTSFDNILSYFKDTTADILYNEEIFRDRLDYYIKRCVSRGLYSLITKPYLHYEILCLSKDDNDFIILGPYLTRPIADPLLYKILDTYRLTIDVVNNLKIFYRSIPVFDTSQLISICCHVAKHLFDITQMSDVKVFDMTTEVINTGHEIDSSIHEKMNIELLEQRYALERSLLKAVSEGNISAAYEASRDFRNMYPSVNRTKDPIRDEKNMNIVLNTLLRKAAEQGGVHPIYLDETSTKWAIRLEKINTNEELAQFPQQLIRAYCILVKNKSLADYSPYVKKALIYINLNLSSEISVSSLANHLNISSDYLTRLFKKELGTSVIDYINNKRIDQSIILLNTTDMQIQSISDTIGITDPNYFGKLFKKYIGVSPKQYRLNLEKQ